MSFLFPTVLTIGLPLLAVPLLIHLINLRRQQHIRWAAMQFLRESQRRNRRWILLKQLFLLATRTAIIGLVVLMLAHLVVRNEWLRLLGSGTTHHIVLLDDSYSMSDRWGNTSAMAEGKRAVRAIVDQAYHQAGTQLVTLIRFSEAAQLSAGAQPQVFSERITDDFRSRLESLLASWDASQTDVDASQALKAVPKVPLADDGQSAILYIVSDCRARQFVDSSDLGKLLDDLRDSEHLRQIHLVRCVQEARPNLAIIALELDSGVRAAGVEMWMSATVTNYGDVPARGVALQIEQDGDALPALSLGDISAHDQVSHKFLVQFAQTGSHCLAASLGADAVDVDNHRYFACELPAAKPVLIIDGSQDGRGGHQLSIALAPGGNARTGWQPHVETSAALLDAPQLSAQAAVCLLDVPRLASDELSALESYVKDGGGVAFFVGPNADRSYYNDQLYRSGEGLFPAPLKLPTQLLDRQEDDAPDLVVTDHPLFRVLAGRRNNFLALIQVDYYYALLDGWEPSPDGHTQVVARLRNQEPLAIEKQFGDGLVVAQLTKLSSGGTPLGRWTNWSLNPAFPVLANELVNRLAAGRQHDPVHQVGDDLAVAVDASRFEPSVRFRVPGRDTARVEVVAKKSSAGDVASAVLEHVATSGVYDAQLQPLDGVPENRRFAVNVATGEGDLAIAHPEELARQFAGVDVVIHDAADMKLDAQQIAGFRMGDALLGAIAVMLLAEQLLAYAASYHIAPQRRAGK